MQNHLLTPSQAIQSTYQPTAPTLASTLTLTVGCTIQQWQAAWLSGQAKLGTAVLELAEVLLVHVEVLERLVQEELGEVSVQITLLSTSKY